MVHGRKRACRMFVLRIDFLIQGDIMLLTSHVSMDCDPIIIFRLYIPILALEIYSTYKGFVEMPFMMPQKFLMPVSDLSIIRIVWVVKCFLIPNGGINMNLPSEYVSAT